MGVTSVAKRVLQKSGLNSFSSVANLGVAGYFGIDAYQTGREEGHGVLASAALAAGEFALPMVMGMPLYLGFTVLPEIPGAIASGAMTMDQRRRELGYQNRMTAFSNSRFNDSEQAYTMRQAGEAIARRSRYNMQVAQLGQEAKYMMK